MTPHCGKPEREDRAGKGCGDLRFEVARQARSARKYEVDHDHGLPIKRNTIVPHKVRPKSSMTQLRHHDRSRCAQRKHRG